MEGRFALSKYIQFIICLISVFVYVDFPFLLLLYCKIIHIVLVYVIECLHDQWLWLWVDINFSKDTISLLQCRNVIRCAVHFFSFYSLYATFYTIPYHLLNKIHALSTHMWIFNTHTFSEMMRNHVVKRQKKKNRNILQVALIFFQLWNEQKKKLLYFSSNV